jgi:hypothetical protein
MYVTEKNNAPTNGIAVSINNKVKGDFGDELSFKIEDDEIIVVSPIAFGIGSLVLNQKDNGCAGVIMSITDTKIVVKVISQAA